MASPRDRYIPALRFHRLTPLYDSFMRWTMQEDTFKRRLIVQAQIQAGQRVLDLGCGTGTLTLLIKQRHPDAALIGLDGDLRVLRMGQAKAAEANLPIAWERGLSYALPHGDDTFDRVLTSLVLHHLTTERKRQTFHEVFRVLRPGGELHIADFGPPHSRRMGLVTALMSRFEETTDNVKGRLPMMLTEAGFTGVSEVSCLPTLFGSLSLYRAAKPVHRESREGR